MEQALSLVMAFFAIIGGIDRIFGNKLKLGTEFEKGLYTLAPLTLSMLGMITVTPTLSKVVLPLVLPVSSFFGFDTSAVAGLLFANDMGSAVLADSLSSNGLLSAFHGLVVSSMFGATISFTVPFSVSAIKKEFHKDVFLGLLCGITTIPIGSLVSGVVMGISGKTLFLNLLPLLVVSVVIIFGLLKFPNITIKIFAFLGKAILVLVTFGLVVGIVQYLTDFVILKNITPINEGFKTIFHIAVILSGTFPLIAIISRLLNKPLKALGKRLSLDEVSVLGFISTLANSIATIEAADKMNQKGRVLNLAFCVSGAFVFGDHLAFTLSYNSEYLLPVIIGKLVAGVTSLFVASFILKKQKAIN